MKSENDILISSFLERTLLKSWKTPIEERNRNFGQLELMCNTNCDLNCLYCYFARYGKSLYPPEISKPEDILKNLEIVLRWLIKNEYTPELNLFTGELFAQKIGMECLDLVYSMYKDAPTESRIKFLGIASNFTFLTDDKKSAYVLEIYEKFQKIGIFMGLSASVEGKYMEVNRPKKLGSYNRDDAYYDRLFEFSKIIYSGFHPMVYSENIELWQKNFLWFQEMFVKHDISRDNLYLLEVRNAEWSPKQILELGRFVKFLVEYTYKELCHSSLEWYRKFLLKGKGFNILSNPLQSVGRGIGCAIQSMMYVRLGDMSIVPCHRTMYPEYTTAKFDIENDEIVGFRAINPELMIGIYTFDANSFPFCSECMIKNLCAKGCLGSQYETTGDMFTPIPSVCQMEHEKLRAMGEAYKHLGIYDEIIGEVGTDKKTAFDNLLNI